MTLTEAKDRLAKAKGELLSINAAKFLLFPPALEWLRGKAHDQVRLAEAEVARLTKEQEAT